MHSPGKFVSVALPVPIRQNYEYTLHQDTQINSTVEIGMRAQVPFGGRQLVGVITDIYSTPRTNAVKLKPVTVVIDSEPCLPSGTLSFYRWAATYYQHSFGEVLNGALPKILREGERLDSPKGWQLTTEGKGLSVSSLKRAPKQREIISHLLSHATINEHQLRDLGFSKPAMKSLADKGLIHSADISDSIKKTSQNRETLLNETPLTLNNEQQSAYDTIEFHRFNCYLVNGVTGSGKTEIYLHLIYRALLSQKQALVLVPEIGLTHQIIERIQKRFNTEIAQLHSNVSEKARALNWKAARDGSAQIIIGTRLAALTPIENLGLIIIDEEHDSSYKQQDGFRYSARDISIYRAHSLGIPIVLGSATPSLESIHNVQEGKYTELKLSQRAGNASIPPISTVDMRNQPEQAGLADTSIHSIEQTVNAGMQAMVFINRRGFAPIYQCHQCGWRAECTSCSSSLTLHHNPRKLVCHHCGRQHSVPNHCPKCHSTELASTGVGTEQVENFLGNTFGNYPVLRIDRDNTQQKDALKTQLESLKDGGPCILVGTQMLAKGHHLPNLNLIVIIDIDQGLFSADFRAAERMGQTITQVAGRAGREEKPGKVLVQTHYPDHPLIQLLLTKGYHAFSDYLLKERNKNSLPPYWFQAVFKAESKHLQIALEFIALVKSILFKIQPSSKTTHYLGPIPDAIEKVNDRYRIILRVTCEKRYELQKLLQEGIKHIDQQALAKRTRWSVDVDAM